MASAVIKEYSTTGTVQNTIAFTYNYTSNTEINKKDRRIQELPVLIRSTVYLRTAMEIW